MTEEERSKLVSAVEEQVNIVKCKECKHYKTAMCALDLWTDEARIFRAKPEDFCSRGEKLKNSYKYS